MANPALMADYIRMACIAWSLGYDQGNRQDIRDGGEADCSSLVLWSARQGGADTGRATYTGNMLPELTAHGWVVVARNPQSAAGLQPGDILLNVTHHTAMVTYGGMLCEASIDERGEITGGQSGDQDGWETHERAFYVYRHGWDYVLRYVGGGTEVVPTPEQPGATEWNPNGYDAAYVREVQERLWHLGYDIGPDGPDGILGPKTHFAIMAFQNAHGLVVDGIPGPATLSALRGAAGRSSATGYRDITALQRAVGADPDSVAGPDTRQRVDAVRQASAWCGERFPYGVEYAQAVVGTYVDGIWGDDSREAHDSTVVAVQVAVGADPDGIWGPDTDARVVDALDHAEQP